jgi:hypothetical protein
LCHDGLTGIDIVHYWLSRRIQPLQYRPTLLCEYSGIDNQQCFTKETLTPEEIEHRIRDVIKIGRSVEMKLGMPIFENGNYPDASFNDFRYDMTISSDVPLTH